MLTHFGLIGRTLKHSFSKGYFTDKFEKLGLSASHQYHLFELAEIDEFESLVEKYGETMGGINVTIPYKQVIIPFLDELDEAAQKIGAINTIKIMHSGTKKPKLIGFNTDYWGFINSLKNWEALVEIKPENALVLGTGGASKAVVVALHDLGIKTQSVSRNGGNGLLTYDELDKPIMDNHLLIVNTTPLGTYPNTSEFPEIPYQYLSENHLLYDLVYNPEETEFLQKGKLAGVKAIHSGLAMLHGQADKAWEIWGK
jgi:shikimate dehydrogenase